VAVAIKSLLQPSSFFSIRNNVNPLLNPPPRHASSCASSSSAGEDSPKDLAVRPSIRLTPLRHAVLSEPLSATRGGESSAGEGEGVEPPSEYLEPIQSSAHTALDGSADDQDNGGDADVIDATNTDDSYSNFTANVVVMTATADPVAMPMPAMIPALSDAGVGTGVVVGVGDGDGVGGDDGTTNVAHLLNDDRTGHGIFEFISDALFIRPVRGKTLFTAKSCFHNTACWTNGVCSECSKLGAPAVHELLAMHQ
jgi:hypothetical protein